MKKFLFLFCLFSLFFTIIPTKTIAENVDVVLDKNDASSSFVIKDSTKQKLMSINTDSRSIGLHCSTEGSNSLALGGAYTTATKLLSVALGSYISAEANHAFVIGVGSNAANRLTNTIPDSLMIGFGNTTPILFVSGDVRNSFPLMYLFDFIFIITAVIFIIKSPKGWGIIFIWLLMAPLPSALDLQPPNALLSSNMIVPLVLLSSFSASYILRKMI